MNTRNYQKLTELLNSRYNITNRHVSNNQRPENNDYYKYNNNTLISTIYIDFIPCILSLKVINKNIYHNSINMKKIIEKYSNDKQQVIIKINDIFTYSDDKLRLKKTHFKIFINWLNKKDINSYILEDIIKYINNPNIYDYIIFKILCKYFNTPSIYNIIHNNKFIFCSYLNNQNISQKCYILKSLFSNDNKQFKNKINSFLSSLQSQNNIKYTNSNIYLNFKQINFNSLEQYNKFIEIIFNHIKYLTKKNNKFSEIGGNNKPDLFINIKQKYINLFKFDNLLINIYKIYDVLVYKKPKTKYLYKSNSPLISTNNSFNFKEGDKIIETYSNFKIKFDSFTHGVLDDLNWDNMIYSGNSLPSLLNPQIKNVSIQSDIDLFIYGKNPDIKYKKIKYLCNFYKNKYLNNVFFAIQRSVITIFIRSNDIIRNIQIINTEHTNPYDIIDNFDLSHVQVFYKNGNIFANYRFIKYYSMMCSKLVSIQCSESRLYKTYLMGYNLINNNKVSLYYPDKFYYFNKYNIKWTLNSKTIIQKLNKYYYPNNDDNDDRVIYLISKIFNIDYNNITINPNLICNKMINSNNNQLKKGINNNNYLQFNINNIKHIINSVPITINNTNNIISNNDNLYIRCPFNQIFQIKSIYRTCHSLFTIYKNHDLVKYKLSKETNKINTLPNISPINPKKDFKLIFVLSLKINKYSNRLIQYFNIIEKHIINKLNIQTPMVPCYTINIIKQTIDIYCNININTCNKIKTIINSSSNNNNTITPLTSPQQSLQNYNLYFKLIGISNLRNYFMYELNDCELLD